MSADYTDDTKAPNVPEDKKLYDHRQLYIEHTRGLWVRKNRKDDLLEIWIDGVEMGAWREVDKVDLRLTTLLRHVFQWGEAKGKADNQKALRDALGLAVPE